MTTATEALLTADEARQILGVSRGTFLSIVGRREIPRIKIGRVARYRRTDVFAYVDRLAAAAMATPR
jgi:excisionase family DNA binding protein